MYIVLYIIVFTMSIKRLSESYQDPERLKKRCWKPKKPSNNYIKNVIWRITESFQRNVFATWKQIQRLEEKDFQNFINNPERIKKIHKLLDLYDNYSDENKEDIKKRLASIYAYHITASERNRSPAYSDFLWEIPQVSELWYDNEFFNELFYGDYWRIWYKTTTINLVIGFILGDKLCEEINKNPHEYDTYSSLTVTKKSSA